MKEWYSGLLGWLRLLALILLALCQSMLADQERSLKNISFVISGHCPTSLFRGAGATGWPQAQSQEVGEETHIILMHQMGPI